jgi:hypothetical protein
MVRAYLILKNLKNALYAQNDLRTVTLKEFLPNKLKKNTRPPNPPDNLKIARTETRIFLLFEIGQDQFKKMIIRKKRRKKNQSNFSGISALLAHKISLNQLLVWR